MSRRKAGDEGERRHAQDEAATSTAQAEFFRAEADRHRRSAERERLFAEISDGEAASGHAARARRLEDWVSQAESVAAALEGRGRGVH